MKYHVLKRFQKHLMVALLLVVSVGSLMAQNAKQEVVSYSFESLPIEKVFDEITRQTQVNFFYQKEMLEKVSTFTYKCDRLPVASLINEISKQTGLNFNRQSNTYSVSLMKSNINKPIGNASIKGSVVDVKGEPIIGASILIKGTSNGTITDMDGRFSLEVASNAQLHVTYVGYISQTVKVAGQNDVSIVLKEDTKALGEVVVTALGIKKESKALTYNLQQIKTDEIVAVKDANFINSLAGKVAGVTINTSSAGIGGGARVVMRGTKSISGNNNALYVIDGIPMPQLVTEQPSDLYTGMGQSGDGIANFNPEDIESMTVLSGASAAALYGSDAANGVIMITTKKGKAEKFSINLSNNTTFSAPFVMPEFQNTYGSNAGEYESWGQKLYAPTNYNPADFFQTGFNTTTSLSLSTGSEMNQTYLSFANVSASGIIQNNDLERNNLSFRNSSSLFDNKLNIDLTFMLMNTKEQNMLAQGQYFNPLVPIYLFPRGDDIRKYQAFERYDASRNFKTQYWPYGDQGMQMQNPYWVTNRDFFNNDKNRYLMGLGLKYDITSWLNVTARGKYDGTNEVRSRRFYASTLPLFAGGPSGAYTKQEVMTTQLYADAMLNFNKNFNDISLTAVLGGSIRDVRYDFSSIEAPINVPNLFTYSNMIKANSRLLQNGYHDQLQSIFATAQIGYKSLVFLDATFRNDWSSALYGTNSPSIAYPSVGLSAIFTDIFPVLKTGDVLSYLKGRLSYSEVGNAPIRYLSNPTYTVEGGFPQTVTYYTDPNLKPERTKSYEAGLNLRLLGNKINFDVTYYKSSTYNQLFNPTISSSIGYKSYYINAGRIDNRGMEMTLGVNQPLGPVDWNSNVTFSFNRNKIVQLLPETEAPFGKVPAMKEMNMGGTDGYRMVLKEGDSMGDIYVNTLKADEHGFIIVDIIGQTVTADPNNFIKAGNANPDYLLGWRNNFEWKGITLGVLINARIGGVGVSATQAKLDAYGVSKESAEARDLGGALVNGERIPAKDYYKTIGGGNSGIGSMYTYSATNVRLAELSLGYDLPVNKWVKWIKGANVALVGRNLIMFYNKAPFDPELTASTGTYFQGIDYFMQPSLQNLGFSVKLNF